MTKNRILVIGGHGKVGGNAVRLLAERYPNQVILGGRRADKAEIFCARQGLALEFRKLHMADGESIQAAMGDDVAVAVSCMQQHCPFLQKNGIARGVHTVDAGINPEVVSEALWLGTRAAASNTIHIVGAGLLPGIASVLAAKLASGLAPLNSIDIAARSTVWTDLGEDAAVACVEKFTSSFEVDQVGRRTQYRGLGFGRRMTFPPETRSRRCFLGPWPELYHLHHTLKTERTFTGVSFREPSIMVLAWLISLWPLRRILAKHRRVQRAFARWWVDKEQRSPDRTVSLVVEAAGKGLAGETVHRRAAMVFPSLAQAAGLGVATMTHLLLQGTVVQPGVHRAEEAFPADALLDLVGEWGGVTPEFSGAGLHSQP